MDDQTRKQLDQITESERKALTQAGEKSQRMKERIRLMHEEERESLSKAGHEVSK